MKNGWKSLKMNEVVRDIEILENLVIAMNEGASDEKYAALYAVEKLLIEKKDLVRKFEEEFCDDTSKVAKSSEIVIDLTDPEGNAFSLMDFVQDDFAKQLDFDVEEIIEEMKSGDYENLVSVFDKYFGDYVVLER